MQFKIKEELKNEKIKLAFSGPVLSRSGYGDHARDLVSMLYSMGVFDIKIFLTDWGMTPSTILENDYKFIEELIQYGPPEQSWQPLVHMQLSLPNEFRRSAAFNIGITAGVETNITPPKMIEGCNNMDLIIVPSTFTKNNIKDSIWRQNHPQWGEIELNCTKPIEVLPEGIHLHQWGEAKNTSFAKHNLSEMLKDETFAFLVVGHWINGEPGHDRKDIFSTLNVFLLTFNGKENKPCLILKTGLTFSKKEHVDYIEKIESIKNSVIDNLKESGINVDLPNIHLLHGDMTRDEMNSLYYHPKVKSMVSFTKGEAFGRPLLEFSFTGKPIIASSWSGHMDFLPTSMTPGLLAGTLQNVHPSVVWQDIIVPEGRWFYVDYRMASQKMLDVWYNYNAYKQAIIGLTDHNKSKFSYSATLKQFDEILVKHLVPFITGKQTIVPVTNVPKLKKIDDGENLQSIEDILGLNSEENKNG